MANIPFYDPRCVADVEEWRRSGARSAAGAAGASAQLSGVALRRMGQTNVVGRYPFHLHLMNDVGGSSFIEDSVIRE